MGSEFSDHWANDMSNPDYDKVQTELFKAIEKNAPHTFKEPKPVVVTLDNGVIYKGVAFAVEAKTDNFPDGLVMVRTSNADLGVPINYIKGR